MHQNGPGNVLLQTRSRLSASLPSLISDDPAMAAVLAEEMAREFASTPRPHPGVPDKPLVKGEKKTITVPQLVTSGAVAASAAYSITTSSKSARG